MTLLDDMMTGRRGVKFAIPDRFTAIDGGGYLSLKGPVPGRNWRAHVSDVRLDLRPEHDQAHRRDIERHTRDQLETCSRRMLVADRTLVAPERARERPLRTADPTWSPLVSVERVDVGDQPALTVIHRTCLLPGNEVVMGHLLVPFQSGLFEVMSVAASRTTGVRASTLFAKAVNESPGEPPEALMKRLGQHYYDDPSHDILFPDHPLSVVRADLREILQTGLVTVIRPADIAPAGETELPDLHCALTPPPRFVRILEKDQAQWSRVSFACTDGIEMLTVVAVASAELPANDRRAGLLRLAEGVAHATPDGATDVHVEVHSLASAGDRAQVSTYHSSVKDGKSSQTACRWLVDDDGKALMMALFSPGCVPKREVLEEIDAVAVSWRPLRKGGKPLTKPWWCIW